MEYKKNGFYLWLWLWLTVNCLVLSWWFWVSYLTPFSFTPITCPLLSVGSCKRIKTEEKKTRILLLLLLVIVVESDQNTPFSIATTPRCNVIFWPSTRPKNAIPRWYTGRKWHIPMASNQKRSRGRIKAYDMGQGEGPIVPLQWCTRRE